MEWNQLFLKKEDWQINTFEEIKKDLYATNGNRFIRYENTEEDHLVIIYGKSQVGKTTLILNMIGLKLECFSEVYETLRAGVPRGNSSTSTAIIYAKSINEKYGCAVASINDISSKNVKFFDKNGMINCLEHIRQQVESNRIKSDSVLFIYIPKNYFIQDSTSDSISIMDMPGVESRNHKEDIHVQNLMTKYIPISSVCIIACRSNDIQSLETLTLPNNLDWKRMDHRFILVVTHAYNDGTTKQYFKKDKSKRKTNFYEYVVEAYTQEIRKILGSNNRTEVFPVDVGDTLTRLCNEEIKSKTDREEIFATKDHVLSDLRKSIVGHKGERLKSALMDLKVITSNYGNDEIQNFSNEISGIYSKIEDKRKLISNTEQAISQLNDSDGEKSAVTSEINNLLYIRSQVYPLTSSCVSEFATKTRQHVLDKSLYKSNSDGEYLNDKYKEILRCMREDISGMVYNYVQKLKSLVDRANANIIINISQIQAEADSIVLQKQDKLYPQKQGFFSRREKVFFSDMANICVSIQADVNLLLNTYVNDCTSKITGLIVDKQNRVKTIDSIISQQQRKCFQYKLDIEQFKKEITKNNSKIVELKNKKAQDDKTLKMYLEYAYQAYMKQRNDIVQQINNSKNVNDKILLILFLGLLDKDYQKVTGGFHETSN